MAKIAFLGAGNLASALVRGLLAKQAFGKIDLACCSKQGDSAAKLAATTGITHEPDLGLLLSGADTVVLAFKPQSLATTDPRLVQLTSGKLVLSVIAGKNLATLTSVFPHARNMVRTMPNLPAAIGAGITPFCSLSPLAPNDRILVDKILEPLGRHFAIEEGYFNALTALGGSGPAFLFEYVAAFRDAGVAAGLPVEIATQVANETVLGSIRVLVRGDELPETLRDRVTSPHGTTAAGLQVLATRQFREIIQETILAATQRAGELSQD